MNMALSQKIQKSPDWHITASNETFSRIAEGEDLYTYLFSKYPTFKTVEKYATDVYLRQYLMDAGAICVNLPINIAKLDNEYFQPMAQIINSEYVMEFVPNELFIWDGVSLRLSSSLLPLLRQKAIKMAW